jgi:hypothetical protein
MDSKPIREVKAGERATSGWTYLSDPAEQPDGSWSVLMQAPSGQRRIVDFDNGDKASDVPA